MGLAEVQKTLAQLYTDSELRERFFNDPLKTGRELGLSAEETQRLAQLSAGEVKQFADTLTGKRLLNVCKLLPFTRRVLKDDFDSRFRRFAAEHKQESSEHYFSDAERFSLHLDECLRREGCADAWVLDLLRFERARVLVGSSRRLIVVRYFRHDIRQLVSSVARREDVTAVVRRPSVAVWWRTNRRAPIRFAIVTPPVIFKRKASEPEA